MYFPLSTIIPLVLSFFKSLWYSLFLTLQYMLYDRTVYLCVWYSLNKKNKKAIIFLTMTRLVWVMGIMCVHCEVGTEFLNNICLYKCMISKCKCQHRIVCAPNFINMCMGVVPLNWSLSENRSHSVCGPGGLNSHTVIIFRWATPVVFKGTAAAQCYT